MLFEEQAAQTIGNESRTARCAWAAAPPGARLSVLRKARHLLARRSDELVDAISPALSRTRADSYAAEILPLLAACRFLELEAVQILKPRRLGRKGLPFWLAGIDSTIERVPLGVVLVIAPANYPLFLGGVQVLQALAAGNAAVWKPGSGGRAVAEVFGDVLASAGLPEGLLRITDESVDAATTELDAKPDKVFFTGSSIAGREVLAAAARHAIPAVAELSGCDAVIVLESADAARVMEALVFGMRLNGSSTCMAPRRLILVGNGHQALFASLQQRFAAMDGIAIAARTRTQLRELLADAAYEGATICGDPEAAALKPLLMLDGKPGMTIMQSDVFAPILTVLRAADVEEAIAFEAQCPFGLTAAIFGDETTARKIGERLNVGTVLINDLIVPTADPRVSFGGRRGSGFGSTRGAEGLLEMTAVKVTSVRTNKSTRHFAATGPAHEALFRAAVTMSHGATWPERFKGLRRLIEAAKKLK